MGRNKPRVPHPDDPVGFDQHLLNMQAYWRYLKIEWRGHIKNKFTMATLVVILLDYARIRLFNYLL